MPLYPYRATLTFDVESRQFAANAVCEIYALEDTTFAAPLSPVDASGLPIVLRSSSDYILPTFYVDRPSVNWRSGAYVFPLVTSQPVPGEKGDAGDPGRDGATVVPTALAIAEELQTPGSAANAALSATAASVVAPLVPPLVASAIADDPSVAADAAALAQSTAGLSLRADPGVPVEKPGTAYVDVATDSDYRIINAILPDGTNYLPLIRSDRRDAGDFLEYTISDPRYKELVLDSDGRVISYITAGGETSAATAAARPWDVFISAGQSNSWITDTLTIPDAIDADSRVYQWDDATKTVSVTPAGSADHIGWATARHWARSFMGSERVAVWARSGYGSTGFSSTSIDPPPTGYQTFANGTWDRTLTADPKNRALELLDRIAAIKAAMPAGSRIILLWSQGENDRYRSEVDGMAWYTAKLDDLFAQARAAASNPEMPILITDMTVPTIEVSEGGQRINQAQEDTPRRHRSRRLLGPGATRKVQHQRLRRTEHPRRRRLYRGADRRPGAGRIQRAEDHLPGDPVTTGLVPEAPRPPKRAGRFRHHSGTQGSILRVVGGNPSSTGAK